MQEFIKDFEVYCKSPEQESGKARSYANGIQYLCDYLKISILNDETLEKLKNAARDLEDKNSVFYNEVLFFLEKRHQKSYLQNGFIKAALKLFFKYANDEIFERKDNPLDKDRSEEKLLAKEGFDAKQEKYELTITAEHITSTDSKFTIDDLSLGDGYKPLDTYLVKANGDKIRRVYVKGERKNTNQTMPRLACQVFERSLIKLSVEEKDNFPVCRYSPNKDIIRGIYSSVDEFKKHRNTIEYMTYKYDNGRQFVFYCWNVFSTIIFVQECLKRFGDDGDKFVLIYRPKEELEIHSQESPLQAKDKPDEYRNPYSKLLIESHNIIFRGAPGTGKSYLAKEIAADVISGGYFDDYTLLSDEQKKQVEFVQFHPSYDYSDFVEGLRPKVNIDGTMGFELQDGVFKKFVERAKQNFEDSQKSKETIQKEESAQDTMADFFSNIEFGVDEFKTVNGNKFTITSIDDKNINILIPANETANKLSVKISEIRRMLESGEPFEKVKDITKFFGKLYATQEYSYIFSIYNAIIEKDRNVSKTVVEPKELKKYIFIIDEINRGEISKIFGELFFAIDPGYRGKAGEVSTQYASLHENPNEKFFIPENVYIIGTMNDIDRSVDTFDFAMRRRFRFIEIKAEDRLEMLDDLKNEALKDEAIKRMGALNSEIVKVEELNENYQIGASYFLKLKTMSFDQLWTDYLQPLLQEYVRGMYDEERIMQKFAKAYGNEKQEESHANETAEN